MKTHVHRGCKSGIHSIKKKKIQIRPYQGLVSEKLTASIKRTREMIGTPDSMNKTSISWRLLSK